MIFRSFPGPSALLKRGFEGEGIKRGDTDGKGNERNILPLPSLPPVRGKELRSKETGRFYLPVSDKYRSTSIAALQPLPAAVMACR